MSLRALLDAIDRRLGHRALLHEALDEPLPGGASWAYVFGSAALVLFGVQLLSGVVLATYYSPSSTDAWASIAYLEREVSLGALVRAIHHHAASGMIIVVLLHLGQVLWFGAYRAPREANWWSGLLLLGLVLAFGLTGYLLPWDQTGYWATKVATGIVGTVPLVGEVSQRVAQGGNDYGNLTLTRFYALHVIVLPIATLGLIGAHLALFRKHGVTPHPSKDAAALARTEPFWPKQVAFDAVASGLVVALVVAIAWRAGAPLEAPADPASNFIARPEWYFLFLFQLLKYFHGALQVVGTTIIPGLAALFLAALPFLDRAPSARVKDRAVVLGLCALGGFFVVLLTLQAVRSDRADPGLAKQRTLAARDAARARELAASGVPAQGAAFMLANDPQTRGERVFRRECLSCHVLEGEGPTPPEAPELTGYRSRAWIRQVLRDADSPRLFGRTKLRGMESFAHVPELEVLVEALYGLRGGEALGGAAAEAAEAHECGNCHDFEEAAGLDGPALLGYLGADWVRAVLTDAGAEHLYGAANTMPAFGGRLSPQDLDAVLGFVLALESRPPRDVWPWRDDPGPVPSPRTSTTSKP